VGKGHQVVQLRRAAMRVMNQGAGKFLQGKKRRQHLGNVGGLRRMRGESPNDDGQQKVLWVGKVGGEYHCKYLEKWQGGRNNTRPACGNS